MNVELLNFERLWRWNGWTIGFLLSDICFHHSSFSLHLFSKPTLFLSAKNFAIIGFAVRKYSTRFCVCFGARPDSYGGECDVISAAINARFIELTQDSQPWPNDLSAAQFVKFKAPTGGRRRDERDDKEERPPGVLQATAELSPSQIQDLGDIVDKLTQIKAKTNTPIKFSVRVEVGDGKTKPNAHITKDINTILKGVKDDFELK